MSKSDEVADPIELRRRLKNTSHAVVKIGSAVFLKEGIRVDRPAFAGLVEGVDTLIRKGWKVTIVSSGAVAMGCQRLGGTEDSTREIPRLQALAAMGQSRLMEMYETEFSHYDREVAQVLFSRGDLSDRGRYLNARRTLEMLHDFGAVAVINENDTVATEELRFGDNDELAAMTAGLLGADTLILLSDVEGLKSATIDADGTRVLGEKIDAIDVDDPRIDQWAGPSTTGVGTGGMISKVRAARVAARLGTLTVIAPGKRPGVLQELAAGRNVGTLFDPGNEEVTGGRKTWLGGGAMARGEIVCDDGARRAVVNGGASLLPSGIVTVRGTFEEGGIVDLVDEEGDPFARGVAVYGSEDLRAIAGEQSSKIEAILGFRIVDEAVHRDNLVLL